MPSQSQLAQDANVQFFIGPLIMVEAHEASKWSCMRMRSENSAKPTPRKSTKTNISN